MLPEILTPPPVEVMDLTLLAKALAIWRIAHQPAGLRHARRSQYASISPVKPEQMAYASGPGINPGPTNCVRANITTLNWTR